MRLIHEVIENLQAWEAAQASEDEDRTPFATVLEELLGGERGSLPQLANQFEEAGLGDIMASWIGGGPNLPIGTKDLRRVLGKARVQELATLAGLPSDRFLARLARLLPAAVHRMTPEGTLGAPIGAGRETR